nr:hypothetical protein [Tanacetum cinerariifolium]
MVRKTCNHPSPAKIGEEDGETDDEKDDKNKAGLAARGLTLNMHNMISRNENLHSCKLLFVTLLVVVFAYGWKSSLLERNNVIEKFQDGEYPILLLTTRVGGVGLNLTQADHIILVDYSWNPWFLLLL